MRFVAALEKPDRMYNQYLLNMLDALARNGVDVTLYCRRLPPKPYAFEAKRLAWGPFRPLVALRVLLDRPDFYLAYQTSLWQLYLLLPYLSLGGRMVSKFDWLWDQFLFLPPRKFLPKRYEGFKEAFINNYWDAGSAHERALRFLRRGVSNLLSRIARKRFLCYVLTEDVRKHLLSRGVPDKHIFFFTHGIDHELFKPAPLAHEGFNILFLGTEARRKGLGDAIKAVRRLNTRFNDLLFSVISQNVQSVDLPNARLLRVHNSTQNLNGILDAYHSADVYVLPSYGDGQPQSVLEAMACGLPVIVTKGIGLEHIIEDGKDGYLIEKGDWQKLAELIALLHDDPQKRKNMGLQARKTAEKLDWGKEAGRFKEFLEGFIHA